MHPSVSELVFPLCILIPKKWGTFNSSGSGYSSGGSNLSIGGGTIGNYSSGYSSASGNTSIGGGTIFTGSSYYDSGNLSIGEINL